MRNETKGYILKEYGAWSVLIIAYLIGLGVSRGSTWQAIPVFIALALLINSKQPFMKWSRRPSARKPPRHFSRPYRCCSIHPSDRFWEQHPHAPAAARLPAAYLAMNRLAGEHFVLTEALGFVLLSLAAVLAKFTITGGVDIRPRCRGALFYCRRVQGQGGAPEKTRDRVVMVLYVVFAAIVYQRFHIALIALLPLVDNPIVAASLYRVKLQTTGWIEVGKSLLYLMLMAFYF